MDTDFGGEGAVVNKRDLDALNADRARLNYLLEQFVVVDNAWHGTFCFDVHKSGLRVAIDLASVLREDRIANEAARKRQA